MTISKKNLLNRCNPGFGASCALCCGSHNYALTQEETEILFSERAESTPERPFRHPEEACYKKLIEDAMQCSHIGMLPDESGIIGCLLYHETDPGKAIESFIRGTCRTFYCPAWEELTDRQVLFAARLMGDWYYYSLLINHIEAVQDICALYDEPEDIPADELEQLKIEVLERFLDEDGK